MSGGETFGQMLRRLRTDRTMLAPQQHGNPSSRMVERTLSQNELSMRAGLDAACVNKLESGKALNPRRATVEVLAEALGLDPLTRDRLLIAAGLWPWPEQAEDVERALSAVHGDFYGEWRATG